MQNDDKKVSAVWGWLARLVLALPFMHEWEVIQQETYRSFDDELIGLTKTNKMRRCRTTGKTQYLDVFCLGLNPPEYMREWITVPSQNTEHSNADK